MSETRKPIDHGAIRPTATKPAPPRPIIPPALAKITMLQYNLPWERAVAQSGLWKMRVLKENFNYGKFMHVGDTYEAPGYDCIDAAITGVAEFVDAEKYAKDQKILEEAERIKTITAKRADYSEFSSLPRDPLAPY